MDDEFITWLTTEIDERGWNNSELARRAGMVPSTISMVISGHNKPSMEFCVKIAQALGESPEHVLRLAGHLTGPVQPVTGESRALAMFRRIPDYNRDLALRVLGVFADTPGADFAPEQVRALRPGESFYLSQWSGETFTKAMALLEALTPDQFDRLVELVQSIRGSSLAQEEGEREGRLSETAT